MIQHYTHVQRVERVLRHLHPTAPLTLPLPAVHIYPQTQMRRA
jgi:hypothetical protein